MEQEEEQIAGAQSCKTPRWHLLKAKLNNLSPRAFRKKLKAFPEAVLVDVRTPNEFAASHLSKAININYFADDFWEQIEALDATQVYLVYCRSGRRSIRVCTLMGNGGFDKNKVFNMEGGLIAWTATFGENLIV